MDDTPQQALWRRLLPWFVAALLLSYLFWRIDLALLLEQLAAINYPAYLAFLVVFCGALLVTDSIATSYVYRRLVAPISVKEFLVIRAASYLPTVINHHLGQVWLTYCISRTYGARMWRTAGATALFYVTTFGCLVALAAISFVLDPTALPWLPTILAVLIGLGVLYLGVVWWAPAALGRFNFVAPIFEMGVGGHLVAFAYRIPHMAVIFVGTWVPFLFFGVDIPLISALALMPPLLLMSAIPVTPQGVGTRDAVALYLFVSFASGSDPEREAAVLATTLSWAIIASLIQIALSMVFIPRLRRLHGSQTERAIKTLEKQSSTSEIV